MTDPLAALALNKLICTGVDLSYETPADPEPRPGTEAAFDALVTQYYKLFRESIRADVAFLRSIEESPSVARFDNTVYQLRTAKQHDDNRRAKAFYAKWARGRSWEAAAEAFLGESAKALSDLDRISLLVRRDAKLTKRWRDNASVEPDAIFEAVCRDMDARFGYGYRQKLLHNISHRQRRLTPGVDVRAAVEQFCAQEITAAEDLTLPVPYHQVLDRLGLLGKRKARAALLVAYSVCAATDLTGEAFLQRVEEAWQVGSS
ncbi:hypothetical protein [Micromonospora sp. S-DT3-3-22]|uniref:hypothetical protein n=1 Tax=Micromonospora sp. S-DT3-3-22 TaxID=2755359 RepID=UPI00189076B0|nr:hypothetical protein [Micromonospora sp. S-DT3-3-22]